MPGVQRGNTASCPAQRRSTQWQVVWASSNPVCAAFPAPTICACILNSQLDQIGPRSAVAPPAARGRYVGLQRPCIQQAAGYSAAGSLEEQRCQNRASFTLGLPAGAHQGACACAGGFVGGSHAHSGGGIRPGRRSNRPTPPPYRPCRRHRQLQQPPLGCCPSTMLRRCPAAGRRCRCNTCSSSPSRSW